MKPWARRRKPKPTLRQITVDGVDVELRSTTGGRSWDVRLAGARKDIGAVFRCRLGMGWFGRLLEKSYVLHPTVEDAVEWVMTEAGGKG